LSTGGEREFEIRKVVELGGKRRSHYIVLPPSVREKAGIKKGDHLRITVLDKGRILLELVK